MSDTRLYIALAGGILLFPCAAAASNLSADAILNMSLTDLANQEVTSVSKKAEKANEAAAAVYVINQEDIKRSGATNIPDALRMVPGLNVAQSGSHGWAISSRGFNNQYANELLVLIDGRTIYSPLFSGVTWELQDTLLEDIDRIEVIRGPGATVWGANAVNGVINIITKSAKDTQGSYASFSAGNMEKVDTSLRHGGKIGEDSYVRAYAKYNDREEQYNIGSGRSGDAWQKHQAGFRSDSKLTAQDSFTLQGDIYKTDEDVFHIFPDLNSPYFTVSADGISASGGNLLGRWTRNISPESSIATQFYVDNVQYKTSYISYNTTTTDLDFQHTWTGWERNEIVWGAGYRLIRDHNAPTALFSLTPTERNDNFYSTFVQDKITLNPNDLFLTLGSKFEHNPYSGFEMEPSARLSWLISESQMAWGSVSRAVHTPNRFTSDSQFALFVLPPFSPPFNSALPAQVVNLPNPGFDTSEELIAYELGYRIQPVKAVSIDIAAFYNDYDKLFGALAGTATAPGGLYIYQPVQNNSINSAKSFGYEISTKIDATKNWQIAAGYSYLNLRFEDKGAIANYDAGQQPKHQFNVRSTYLFPYNIEMTNALYYVDQLSSLNIDGYYRFDTKLSYEVMKGVEASLVGQNLLRQTHREFSQFSYQAPSEIGRSIYANVTFRF